jgi:hypothetical protein
MDEERDKALDEFTDTPLYRLMPDDFKNALIKAFEEGWLSGWAAAGGE